MSVVWDNSVLLHLQIWSNFWSFLNSETFCYCPVFLRLCSQLHDPVWGYDPDLKKLFIIYSCVRAYAGASRVQQKLELPASVSPLTWIVRTEPGTSGSEQELKTVESRSWRRWKAELFMYHLCQTIRLRSACDPETYMRLSLKSKGLTYLDKKISREPNIPSMI